MPSAEEIERKRQDLIKNYGVWVARPVWFKTERVGIPSPHVYLKLRDTQDDEIEAALNVGNNGDNSQLVYRFEKSLSQTSVDRFKPYEKDLKFHGLTGDKGLDYTRDTDLVDKIKKGIRLPHDIPGRGNDILDKLTPLLERSIEEKAIIYVFGSKYDPDPSDRSDKPFKRGIHNIHMNQGSDPKEFPNVTHRDGAIFFHFEKGNTWSGLFLAFASQRIPTKGDGKAEADAKKLEDQLEQ